jgi:hypothetical protein
MKRLRKVKNLTTADLLVFQAGNSRDDDNREKKKK